MTSHDASGGGAVATGAQRRRIAASRWRGLLGSRACSTMWSMRGHAARCSVRKARVLSGESEGPSASGGYMAVTSLPRARSPGAPLGWLATATARARHIARSSRRSRATTTTVVAAALASTCVSLFACDGYMAVTWRLHGSPGRAPRSPHSSRRRCSGGAARGRPGSRDDMARKDCRTPTTTNE